MPTSRSSSDPGLLAEATLRPACDESVARTTEWMLKHQAPPGYWVAELEGDTILESEYVMLLYFLEQSIQPKMHLLAEHLRRKQMPDGAWSQYPGGPSDVSGSVKAYFVLKLVGDAPEAPHMVRARQAILALGGVTAVNSFTKFGLALLGQYDWNHVPAIPPELILLPRSFYVNIYAMSSWSRAMVVTMAMLWACKPTIRVPDHAHIDELFVGGRDPRRMAMKYDWRVFTWRNFFLVVDRFFKKVEASGLRPWRAEAMRRCEAWMVEHFQGSGGVGAIFPPMVNSVMCLRTLGYPDDHPYFQEAMREVQALEIVEGDTMRMQPCFSPVWDTALSLVCMQGAQVPGDHPAVQKAARWLLSKEVTHHGDIHCTRAHPVGGWYFEFANEFYPDVDDTIMTLMALDRVRFGEDEEPLRKAAMERGLRWTLSMQCSNGGWAAFDVDNDRALLEKVPFADHNAMLDPPTSDITSRTLECLARFGYRVGTPLVDRAVDFLRADQSPEGCWYGRWGVNYLYGTWQVLRGLEVIGADMSQPWIQKGAAWLRRVQNADGGWGESIASYDDPSLKGQGASTASQTAWALMGLLSAGDCDGPEVRRGIRYLLDTQAADGSWPEDLFTGTGFPRVFYLKYHMYSVYFPLYALGRYRGACAQRGDLSGDAIR